MTYPAEKFDLAVGPQPLHGISRWWSKNRPNHRLLAILLVVSSLVVGGRWLARLVNGQSASRTAISAQHSQPHLPFPTSAPIEGQWGIRFTAVDLLADGGLLDVKYQVLDPVKGGRIHSGGISSLPVIAVEGDGNVIHPNSVMFHFHHGEDNTGGRTYSIIYGNSGGAVHPGDRITLILSDGSRLKHVTIEP